MLLYKTNAPEETESVAAALSERLVAGDVLAFYGDLGAGKTAFTRGLARGLCCPMAVSSPTFSLVHEYRGGRLLLCHFDLYRIQSQDDLESTGFYDYLDGENAVLAVEWSERLGDALPENAITVRITTTGDTERSIEIKGDERF